MTCKQLDDTKNGLTVEKLLFRPKSRLDFIQRALEI